MLAFTHARAFAASSPASFMQRSNSSRCWPDNGRVRICAWPNNGTQASTRAIRGAWGRMCRSVEAQGEARPGTGVTVAGTQCSYGSASEGQCFVEAVGGAQFGQSRRIAIDLVYRTTGAQPREQCQPGAVDPADSGQVDAAQSRPQRAQLRPQ